MWSATTRPQPQGYRGHGFCQKGLEAMVMQLTRAVRIMLCSNTNC
ncbi:hypothetical protein AB3S75_005117 [Citrus x aurantiifolia]